VQKHLHALELFTPPTLIKKIVNEKKTLALYIMIKLTKGLLLGIEYE